MFYDLNCKIVNTYNFPSDIEILLLELALAKRKWLILGLYKTLSLRSEIFISEVTNSLIFYCEKYDNVPPGDFIITSENHHLKDFTNSNDFENLIKEGTCFKWTSPTTNDPFLTNTKCYFIKFWTNKTGIPDHHKLIYTFLNLHTLMENLSLFTIDALKTLTKNYSRRNRLGKIFLKIWKTLVFPLKRFMTLSRTY